MSKENEEESKLFKSIQREFSQFASLYSDAVKSGADVAGKQILESMLDVNQAEEIPAGKLFSGVKSGVRHAGEQLIQLAWGFIYRPKK